MMHGQEKTFLDEIDAKLRQMQRRASADPEDPTLSRQQLILKRRLKNVHPNDRNIVHPEIVELNNQLRKIRHVWHVGANTYTGRKPGLYMVNVKTSTGGDDPTQNSITFHDADPDKKEMIHYGEHGYWIDMVPKDVIALAKGAKKAGWKIIHWGTSKKVVTEEESKFRQSIEDFFAAISEQVANPAIKKLVESLEKEPDIIGVYTKPRDIDPGKYNVEIETRRRFFGSSIIFCVADPRVYELRHRAKPGLGKDKVPSYHYPIAEACARIGWKYLYKGTRWNLVTTDDDDYEIL